MPATPNRPHHAVWPTRLPRELVIPATTLWFNLEVSARRYPDKAAYRFLGRDLSYAELHAQAEALAGWLMDQGLQAGERVLLFLQNCPQFVVAFYAVQRANAVVVPVNPMNKADEFGHYITDPQARFAITSADLAAIVSQADEQLPAAQRLHRMLVTRYSDAMPEGGRLTIETANKWLDDRTAKERDLSPGQYVSLCVTDTGTGMSDDTRTRVDGFFAALGIEQAWRK